MNPEPITRTQATDTLERVREAVSAADDRKALDLKVLQLEKVTDFADYFLICSGTSERQVQAIADAVQEKLREHRVRPLHVEGYNRAQWVLIDYGDLVVHESFHDYGVAAWDLDAKIRLSTTFITHNGEVQVDHGLFNDMPPDGC